MIRQHQVSLQVSPHLFLDSKREVVVSADVIPLVDAKTRGWLPILVYGVCCSSTRLKAIRLVASDEPISMMDALLEIWRDDQWMRGVPDEVAMCPELLDSHVLRERLEGLAIASTLGNRKSYAINRRLIGKEFHSLVWYPEPPSKTIDDLNTKGRRWLGFHPQCYDWGTPSGLRIRTDWENTPYRAPPEITGSHPVDWIYGPWVEIGFANAIGVGRGEKLKKTHAGGAYRIQPRDTHGRVYPDFELSHLVASWPGRHARLAREIGVPESRLRAYIRGRDEVLDGRERSELFRALELEFDSGGYLNTYGPYLLMPQTPSAADKAWSLASHGGDLEFGSEIVSPLPAQQHNEWHIVLGRAHGSELFIFLIPREGRLEDPLPARWRDKMINLAEDPHALSVKDFQSLSLLLPALIAGTVLDGYDRGLILRTLEEAWEPTFQEMASRLEW